MKSRVIASRQKNESNHVEILIKSDDEESAKSLEEVAKKAVRKWNRNLIKKMSYEIVIIIRNNA